MSRKLLCTLLVVVALGVAACTDEPTAGTRGPLAPGESAAGALQPFADCDALVAYASEHAAELSQRDLPDAALFDAVGAEEADGLAAADAGVERAAEAPPNATNDYSTTNIQESGVDEADVVKTDGTLVVTSVGGTLRVLDASAGEPTVVGSIPLEGYGPHELFLEGDRLLVVATADGTAVAPLEDQEDGVLPPEFSVPATLLAEVDLRDPAEPVVVATRQVDGSYLSARAADGTARIVISSSPPFLDQGAIEDADAQAWLPTTTIETTDGDVTREPLVDCDQVSHPEVPAGLGTVTVLSVDLRQPLDDLQPVSVMADGQQVYASTDNLYVATSGWASSSDAPATDIHQFATDEPGPARYRASGTVEGTLLNQFALSEHDGRLRVATTEENWRDGTSDSAITIFDRAGDHLDPVGRVDGMGEGEQIYAVRFLGDTAYVVTFRQTDPLYTVDLSDPADPRVVGELKIAGYSAYLHPIGDDLLIGVGQDADDEGRTLGTQVSLFDVSDPAAPKRLQQYAVDQATSAAEYDHRAFLWWPEEDLAIVPVEDYTAVPFSGAIGFDVTRGRIGERGRIVHNPSAPIDPQQQSVSDCLARTDCEVPIDDVVVSTGTPIVRSLVVNGDEVWTVSEAGVKVSDIETLDDRDWIAF